VLGGAFLILCLISFLSGFATSPFNALFPVYVDTDLNRVPLFTGSLRSLMLVLGGVFAVIGGRLCDLLGLKKTLLLGLGGTVFTGLIFCTSNPWILILLIFFIGAAAGPWSTAGQSYLIRSVSVERLGLGSALYFLSGTSGNALGGLLTGLLKEEWSFPEIGTTMTVAMVGVFVLALFLMPAGTTPAPAADTRPRLALWATYKPLLLQRNVHLLIGMRYMITSFWGMATLLLPLLVSRIGGSASMAAYYAAVSLSVAAGCQLLVGFLADRYGRLWPLLISAGGVVLSGFCLGMWWNSLTGLFVFGTALTSTAWAVSTLVPGLINAVASAEEKNRLVGLGHTIWSGAMVSGSILGGLLQTLVDQGTGFHPGTPFFVGTALATGGSICAAWLCTRLNRQKA
jgi:MFS family permease